MTAEGSKLNPAGRPSPIKNFCSAPNIRSNSTAIYHQHDQVCRHKLHANSNLEECEFVWSAPFSVVSSGETPSASIRIPCSTGTTHTQNGITRNVTFKFEDSDDVTSMDGDDRSRIQYTSTKSDDINSLVGIDRTRILYTSPKSDDIIGSCGDNRARSQFTSTKSNDIISLSDEDRSRVLATL